MLLPGFRSPAHFLLPGGVPKACSASLDADPVEAASEGDCNPQSRGVLVDALGEVLAGRTDHAPFQLGCSAGCCESVLA